MTRFLNSPVLLKMTASIILIFILSNQSLAQIESTIQGDLSDRVLAENPEYHIKYNSSRQLTDGYVSRFFVYTKKDSNWPGGVGFEITHPERSEPLWFTMIHGDFGPHHVQLIDMNLDGKSDLLFFVGFEDVFSTYIYTANYEDGLKSEYDKDNFQKTYTNENDYSVLIRLNGEADPTILDSGYTGKVNRSGLSCFENQSDLAIMPDNKLVITQETRDEIEQMYKEVTADLDQYNFDYNMPQVYPVINTFLLDPIKLYKIDGSESVEVTSQYPEYLKWRIDLLKKIKEDSSERCATNIDRTIHYLESHLN